jgi:hypothetical protein
MKIPGQIFFYALFMAVVGFFSISPELQLRGADEAVISISFSHAGQRVGECRILTQDELNALPPNMRKPAECPRGRQPLRVELKVDDKILYSETLLSSGLWSDGKATVYQRIPTTAGEHRFQVSMDDAGNPSGFNRMQTESIVIEPGQNLVIDFDELAQDFVFK